MAMTKTDKRIVALRQQYGDEYAQIYVRARALIAHMEGAADAGAKPADRAIVDCDLDILAARINGLR